MKEFKHFPLHFGGKFFRKDIATHKVKMPYKKNKGKIESY